MATIQQWRPKIPPSKGPALALRFLILPFPLLPSCPCVLQSNEAVAALHTLLESRCPASLLPSLRGFLKDEGTYLLLHHRFVNLPLPLVPALHKSIREDLTWAVKNTVRARVYTHINRDCSPWRTALGKAPQT